MIRPNVLARFAERFAPQGFDATAFVPSYGMAEATLALSFTPPGQGARHDVVDRSLLESDHHAVPARDADAPTRAFVLCGPILPDHDVEVRDEAGRALVRYFRRKRVDVSRVERVPGWTTATKSRFLAGWTHTTQQQVLRVDREPGALPETARRRLEESARFLAGRADAILFSDYGLGVVTPALARRVLGRRRRVATIDSRHDLFAFAGLGITAATPNEPELEALYHTHIGSDLGRLARLGERARRKMGLESLVVTRGKDGMVVFDRGRKPRGIPIYGTDQAADVTGAGDTVIAVFTLALAAGAASPDVRVAFDAFWLALVVPFPPPRPDHRRASGR